MKFESPNSKTPFEKNDEVIAGPSRLLDEKISDESGTETQAGGALAPAGLSNPFWN